jgi:hypothetical protein
MRDEYDFSKGERGKFYKPDAQLNLPVYLDDEVRAYLQRRATAKTRVNRVREQFPLMCLQFRSPV